MVQEVVGSIPIIRPILNKTAFAVLFNIDALIRLNPRVIALAITSRGVVQSSEEKLACSFFKQTKEACEQADIP